jgi:hypothetical protein
MKNPIKWSFLTVLAILMAFGPQTAFAQRDRDQDRDHRGYQRFHVWRNERWGWEYHPVGWVAPTELVGPSQVDISLGWSNHPGWQRYHVWRNNRWDYVYHPAGWQVPGAWRGPHGRHHDHS